MRLIEQNEDGTLNIFEADRQNCENITLKNASGIIEYDSKFESAIRILKALCSEARIILYDTSHKSLHAKLTNELELPVLSPNSNAAVFNKIPYDVMLFTSGTTGMPLGAFKTKRHLYDEIAVLEALLRPYGICKMVASVPFIHIYGVLMLNLAKHTNMDLWFRDRFLPADLAALVDKNTVVATTPLYINALLQMSEEYDFGGALFVSSTAPLSQESSKEFCDRFNANVIQLYGSTETGGIAYRKNADKLWTPFDGVECRKSDDGCLCVKSPWVCDIVYENGFRRLDGEVRTFDEVEFDFDKFELIGRKSNIIKIGGKRLSTIQIENIIEKHYNVKSCLIDVAARDTGSLKDESLIIYIDGVKPSINELKSAIKSEIGAVNIPMKIVMVEKIPKSSIGKKIRDFKNLKSI